MILIGQYDSPFVRRVAIALRLYGLAYEHRPWSTFADAEQIAQYNPVRRVPTLVLDDGEVLIDSVTILDHLDALAGPMKALIAPAGPARRQALKICALATGLADKAVSLVYERVLHQQVSQAWIDRCVAQVAGVLDTLQTDRAGRATSFWFGETIGHADIAVACALRFTTEAHPTPFDLLRWPSLAAYAARCEALAPFQAVTQRFIPPA
jgi:glutathione S-transferase